MDSPLKRRPGRPRKETKPKRGRPRKILYDVKKSEIHKRIHPDKQMENNSEQKLSGEIVTRLTVKNSVSRKLRPPKPPPYTNKEKWKRMNTGQKMYAMRQYNLSLIIRGMPVDKTLPGSFNFKSSYFTPDGTQYAKKPKISLSNAAKNSLSNTAKKLKPSTTSCSKNDKPDSSKDDETSDDSDSESEESDMEKKNSNSSTSKQEQSDTDKKSQSTGSSNSAVKPGMERKSKTPGSSISNAEKSVINKKSHTCSSNSNSEKSGMKKDVKQSEILGANDNDKKLPSSGSSISNTEKSGIKKEKKQTDLLGAKGTVKKIIKSGSSNSKTEEFGAKKEVKPSSVVDKKGIEKTILKSGSSNSKTEELGAKTEVKPSCVVDAKGMKKEVKQSRTIGTKEKNDVPKKHSRGHVPISLLREYNLKKKEIVETNDEIVFGKQSWPKTSKTNFLIGRPRKDGAPKDYYTLESILFIMKNEHLRHPLYVQQANERNIPHVWRLDRKKLLGYLNGTINQLESINENLSAKTGSDKIGQLSNKSSTSEKSSDADKKIQTSSNSKTEVADADKKIQTCSNSKTGVTDADKKIQTSSNSKTGVAVYL